MTRPSSGDLVDLLAPAVAAAVNRLAALDEDAPSARSAARDALLAVMETVAPVRAALTDLIAADPDGGLGIAWAVVLNAHTHVETGATSAVRAAVITANVALARLVSSDEPDPGGNVPDWGFWRHARCGRAPFTPARQGWWCCQRR